MFWGRKRDEDVLFNLSLELVLSDTSFESYHSKIEAIKDYASAIESFERHFGNPRYVTTFGIMLPGYFPAADTLVGRMELDDQTATGLIRLNELINTKRFFTGDPIVHFTYEDKPEDQIIERVRLLGSADGTNIQLIDTARDYARTQLLEEIERVTA